jgi:glycerol-3-phosphate O-acyltransferase
MTGPLSRFEKERTQILSDVVSRSEQELRAANPSLDLLVGQALYQERLRLKRNRPNLFTRGRAKRDHQLWNGIQGSLLRPQAEADRGELLHRALGHYAAEIGGHYDPVIYKLAVSAVPFLFSWLLNAASVRRFVPWGMTQSLESNISITGEIPLLKKLSQKGTVLLVPTHQSNIDSLLIGYVIYLMGLPPFAYGAGLNLYSNPVLSFFMSRLGAYTVDRTKNNPIYKQALKNYSTTILRSGVHSIFFPGGGRMRSGAVESKLKLGLLGTGLEAQLENHKLGKPNPSVFVVPMVMSYNFVLEASSLIEDYLAEAGKHRYIIMDDESWQVAKIAKFFWKIFSVQSGVTIRIGKPLDVFGNSVDEEGRSIGPNGTRIDPVKWLTTRGELRPDELRDREYTRELGARLVDRFHKENTVLPSHLVAFTLFEMLRKRYPDLDVYRFLRLSLPQRSLPYGEFIQELKIQHQRVRELSARGQFYLAPELQIQECEDWVARAIGNLGLFHEAHVIRVRDGVIYSEDLNLLYYYRNRLSGYGLSFLADALHMAPGDYDRKGFLA